MSYPKGFVWGAATASYQIEGATKEDGRGASVWDMLCGKPGAIFQGQTGDIACDHYHRYKEDVALMKGLGLGGYRFSVAWPRVMPEGTGAVNAKGLEFYDRLVDELLAAGIEPWATLFHWDYPLALYHRGGWLNPDSPSWFADYSATVVDRLGDRVSHWFTLNEPQCFIGLGHHEGVHAPGDKLRWSEVLLAAHHALIAHGLSVQVIRARAKKTPRVGYAPVGSAFMPATDSPEDIEAARQKMFAVQAVNPWQNAWWMDPVFLGRYPEDGIEFYGSAVPGFTDEQMRTISQPLDFFGANIYQGNYVQAGSDGTPEVLPMPLGTPLSAFRWPITPECLYWGPRYFYERYGKPIVISENGMSGIDWVGLDGTVPDGPRIDYVRRHLRQLGQAMDDGVPVEGYFLWSLMDNFEWAEGYKERFGIVHIDYETQKRTPKDSYRWYGEVVRSNASGI